eukprot:GILJ01014421.1.p1 GENE.GILJ01014421.1~~GILJ01014421.1.p1  ORF type:complete len:356 (+),score=35.26 GILJ01014421.1:112-1179(+)
MPTGMDKRSVSPSTLPVFVSAAQCTEQLPRPAVQASTRSRSNNDMENERRSHPLFASDFDRRISVSPLPMTAEAFAPSSFSAFRHLNSPDQTPTFSQNAFAVSNSNAATTSFLTDFQMEEEELAASLFSNISGSPNTEPREDMGIIMGRRVSDVLNEENSLAASNEEEEVLRGILQGRNGESESLADSQSSQSSQSQSDFLLSQERHQQPARARARARTSASPYRSTKFTIRNMSHLQAWRHKVLTSKAASTLRSELSKENIAPDDMNEHSHLRKNVLHNVFGKNIQDDRVKAKIMSLELSNDLKHHDFFLCVLCGRVLTRNRHTCNAITKATNAHYRKQYTDNILEQLCQLENN